MMWHYNTFGLLGMGLGFIYMLLFWGFIIWFFIWIFQRSDLSKNKKNESALDILKKRYAKGEISRKQFNQIKKEVK